MTVRAWLVVAAVAAVTYALRASLIVLFARVGIPPLLARAFRYVAPAVMAALAVPAFLAPSGTVALAAPELAAGVVGGLVAWRFRSMPGTLAAGLAAYTLVALVV